MNDWIQWAEFLDKLQKDWKYVVSLEFVITWNTYDSDGPTIILSKPILVESNSNPILISKFVNDRIIQACLSYKLNEKFYDYPSMLDKKDIPGVIVKYAPLALDFIELN